MNTRSPSTKILIVDDQREVRRMLKAALESQFPNAVLHDVPSAEEAMVLLSQDVFNLLVVDVRLAGMSGLEMVEKARRRQPVLNIVVITGLNDPAIHQKLEQAPIQAWFHKPLPMEEFLACVTSLLGESATPLPSPTQAAPSALQEEEEEPTTTNPWDALCERMGLRGLWIGDLQGNPLAQSTNAPSSPHFSQLVEYFSQVETEIGKLQSRYGAEEFHPLAIYLSEDSAASQLRFDDYLIIFCVEKGKLPPHPLELQMALIREGQELLEVLRGDPSYFAQYPASEQPAVAENAETTATPDASLEVLLENPFIDLSQSEKVDEFWEQSLATEDWAETANHSQTLRFHQARQLGILPSDQDEDPFKG